jgi:hypothetical protein
MGSRGPRAATGGKVDLDEGCGSVWSPNPATKSRLSP